LVNAGLLDREQRGAWAYYSLRRDVLRRLGSVFEGGNDE
jgi:ArsR family transcriptional regulator